MYLCPLPGSGPCKREGKRGGGRGRKEKGKEERGKEGGRRQNGSHLLLCKMTKTISDNRFLDRTVKLAVELE